MIEYTPPTDYELRKAMFEVMDDKEIRSIAWNKKREASEMRVPRDQRLYDGLTKISDWLKLPYEMVHNSYLEEMRRDCNTVVDEMELELRKRQRPDSMVDLATLKAEIPIETVIKHYVPGLKWTKICCPFHDERSPSLQIYRNNNSWHCFGCHAGWSQIDFIKLSEKCSVKQAIERLKSFS